MNKLELKICGTHCKSCKILLEDDLGQLPNIKEVKVDWRTGQTEVFYHGDKPSLAEIEKAVAKLGYNLGAADGVKLDTRRSGYEELGVALVIILGLYFVIAQTGLLNFDLSNLTAGFGWSVATVVGLVAGFSSCMALIGGLVLGVAANYNQAHPEINAKQKFAPHLMFNFGRVISFSLFGGILGLLGKGLNLNNWVIGSLTLLIGLVMLLLGIKLTGLLPALDKWNFSLPAGLGKFLGLRPSAEINKKYSHRKTFILGGLTFFLPCGFTQAMQLASVASGSFFGGALTMGLFSLGTSVGLLSMGGLASVMKGKGARIFYKTAGLAVVAFAIFNLTHALKLISLSLPSSTTPANNNITVSDPNVKLVNGVQVVNMTESSTGYTPNHFTVVSGVPVEWVIDAQEPYSCASTILLPAMNITEHLVAGKNTIKFTPTAAGELKFSCSMGMYFGSFTVVAPGQQSNLGSKILALLVQPVEAATKPASKLKVVSQKSLVKNNKSLVVSQKSLVKPVAASKPVVKKSVAKVQVIKAVYTNAHGLQPQVIKVKAGQKVSLHIAVKDSAYGCMSTIMIPGLDNNIQLLSAGQNLQMNFTAAKKGVYPITCAMHIPHGEIDVD